jgi:type VI secretion system protein ImpM
VVQLQRTGFRAALDHPRTPRIGFFGKLPTRGDFVRVGLPRGSVEAWDGWLRMALSGSQSAMGEVWQPAWMEAPVWRFALPDGMCGPAALLGLWMPSVDRVGRYFPLMLAACCPEAEPAHMVRGDVPWLDAAEEAGRAALADDLSPDALAARIPPWPAAVHPPETELPYGMIPRPGAGLWWTEGSPRVPAQGLVLDAMPDVATFVAMLDASFGAPRGAG